MRILKKYPNRRIYDTEESRYIKLEDVRVLVRKRVPLQVVDSKSGEDITRVTLLQIITEMEQEGHGHLLTNQVLEELIRFYDHQMGHVLSAYLEASLASFLKQQERMLEMKNLFTQKPIELFNEMARQQQSFFEMLFRGRD